MKIALISGANSGIGLAASLELARQGYVVYAGTRSLGRVDALLRAAEAERLQIEPLELDVTSLASCTTAVGKVMALHGHIDVLINNAGVGMVAPIEEADLDQVREAFETNFFGAKRLVQLVLPGMRKDGKGCIVNVSSVAGRFVSAAQGFYSASKSALEAASEALAQEVRHFGIRVVIIEPGVTKTAALEKMPNINPNSAYTMLLKRGGRTLGSRVSRAADASSIARAIRNAIESTDYKLRHPLGEDTHMWIRGRAKLTDEQWVEYGRDMSDADVAQFWKQYFDMDV